MAIARGAGTEIIRSAFFQDVDAEQDLIVGVQHHIYTVLSIIVACENLAATTDKFEIYVVGWDAHNGATDTVCKFAGAVNLQVGETFVWNDKFSFNGFEPTGISGDLGTAAEQDAIADQGGSVAQFLRFLPPNVTSNYDVIITFIDQNNS